jgi:hypothetical protein
MKMDVDNGMLEVVRLVLQAIKTEERSKHGISRGLWRTVAHRSNLPVSFLLRFFAEIIEH